MLLRQSRLPPVKVGQQSTFRKSLILYRRDWQFGADESAASQQSLWEKRRASATPARSTEEARKSLQFDPA
jgi:hypothetical protein